MLRSFIRPYATTIRSKSLRVVNEDLLSHRPPRIQSKPVSAEERESQRVFFTSINLLLRNKRSTEAFNSAKKAAGAQVSTALKQSYYEKSINAFVNHGAIKEAHGLYKEEIADGLVPSTSVTSYLLRAWGKAPEKDPRVMKTIGRTLVTKPVLWDDGLLCAFLSNLIAARRFNLLEEMVASYTALSKTSDGRNLGPTVYSTLIRGFCVAKRTPQAVNWLQQYREACQTSGKTPVPRPYIDLLWGFARQTSEGSIDPLPCYTIVKQMIEDGVPLSIHVFNILMALENRNGNPGRAFTLLRILERKHPTIAPNAGTFSSLFKSHQLRKYKSRPIPKAYSPRALFKHMLLLHHSYTRGVPSKPSPFLVAETLNTALGAFLRSRDYPAATVALRTFAVCRLVPNSDTERIITSHIWRRMGKELSIVPDSTRARWVNSIKGDVVTASEVADELERIQTVLNSIKEDAKQLVADDRAIVLGEATAWMASSSRQPPGHSLDQAKLIAKMQRKPAEPVKISRLLDLIYRATTAVLPPSNRSRGTSVSYETAMAQACSEMLPQKRKPRRHAK